MKNDLDRPLRATKAMREEGYFLDPERMSNQDLVDECIALGASIILEESDVSLADYHILAGDILDCIEMSMADYDTIQGLMTKVFGMYCDKKATDLVM